MKKVIVIKLGTSSITHDEDGSLDLDRLEAIGQEISVLMKHYHILLVSSGAVGTGKKFLQNYKATINDKKAAAAIGNPILMDNYRRIFEKHKIVVAQCLFERHHFSERKPFLQLKQTIETLWKSNVLPIANDNDVVNDTELRFSDNDELAALLAISFNAEQLMIGSSVEGLLDKNNQLINEIKEIDEAILSMANKNKSKSGLGGMISKLNFTKLATSMGVQVTIFNAKKEGALTQGFNKKGGTLFHAKESKHTSRQRWIAAGGIVCGKVRVDNGAENAIKNRKSLLSVGISQVLNPFENQEIFEIINSNEELLALGIAKISSNQINKSETLEIANANDIVVF
jgi:glutamate 5-kinase